MAKIRDIDDDKTRKVFITTYKTWIIPDKILWNIRSLFANEVAMLVPEIETGYWCASARINHRRLLAYIRAKKEIEYSW